MKRYSEVEKLKPKVYLYIRAATSVSLDELSRLEKLLIDYCRIHGYRHVGTVMSRGGKNYGMEFIRRDIQHGCFKDVDKVIAVAHGGEKERSAFSRVRKLLRSYNINVPIVVVKEDKDVERI